MISQFDKLFISALVYLLKRIFYFQSEVDFMNVTVESSGNLMIAYLIGELDHHSAGAVRDKIDSSISCMKPNHLILDFKNVSFMD